MPKAQKTTYFPRRQFEMTVRFDKDHNGPQIITIPIGESPKPSHHELEEDDFNGGMPGPSSSSPEGLSFEAEASPGPAPEEDEEGDDPFGKIRDKRFYGSGHSFYYYLYVKADMIPQPPPHPASVKLQDDTLFIHRNPLTQESRTWKWGSSPDNVDDKKWILVQEREKYEFPHGVYHYVTMRDGQPSWVVFETLRKKKYQDAPPSASGSKKRGARKAPRKEP
ncbi:hypothetical protein DFP72DRAFT_862776 [Ephemerocybe angulata]|uniref:Uncharacterized protein n=1 Tax=Ephemerocybe angulata TaxID=980116 RepID=A0A8H6H6A7_9AGAR|nr:hypothetical protein DFP72DRAFT_862776 [Tulosesus angulatus]